MPVNKIQQLPLENPCKSSQFHCSAGLPLFGNSFIVMSDVFLFFVRVNLKDQSFFFFFACLHLQRTITVYSLSIISCYLVNALVSFSFICCNSDRVSCERLFCCKQMYLSRLRIVMMHLDVCAFS